MKYVVISDKNKLDFEKKVNFHLKEGWELKGNLTIVSEGYDKIYHQKMIFRD